QLTMVIAGAGGHALELLDILIARHEDLNLYFYDDINEPEYFRNKFPIIRTTKDLRNRLKEDSRFLLGVGGPKIRSDFYTLFRSCGGEFTTVKSNSSIISHYSDATLCDIFNFCFVGPEAEIGLGSLLNSGSQVHHEVKIGDFSEVNPGAIL